MKQFFQVSLGCTHVKSFTTLRLLVCVTIYNSMISTEATKDLLNYCNKNDTPVYNFSQGAHYTGMLDLYFPCAYMSYLSMQSDYQPT